MLGNPTVKRKDVFPVEATEVTVLSLTENCLESRDPPTKLDDEADPAEVLKPGLGYRG